MALTRLDPEESYEDTASYSHGFGCTSHLEGILEEGALTPKNRRESSGFDYAASHVYEDILKHAGNEVTAINLNTGQEVKDYLETHRGYFEEQGHEYTNWIMNNIDQAPLNGVDFNNNVVWISHENAEAQNYACTENVPGGDESGGYFELSLPEEAVVQLGLNGAVPGEIPLEFVDRLNLENVEPEAREEIWIDMAASEYDIEINSVK